MEKWRKDWVEKKKNIALRLSDGHCGGSYGESVIILCTVLSTLAAEIWPGDRKDRARFVELLTQFAPTEASVKKISIPLLVAYLRDERCNEESEIIRKAFLDFSPSLVITGDDVDKSEEEIMRLCDTLDPKALRYHSYANLLYTEVRSGYVHEYKPGRLTDPWQMTQGEASISYVNWTHEPDTHVHFHIGWLGKLALSIAEAVDEIANTLPRNDPQSWWIDGRT